MYWVTSKVVHFDRVASSWLISRFIDSSATFGFIDPAEKFPEGAVTYGIAGGDIGRHDEDGTTFSKLLQRYALTDGALGAIEKIVSAGVAYIQQDEMPKENDRAAWVAIGLLAVGEGMLLIENNDHDILERSLPIWDAVYADAAFHLLRNNPPGADADPDVLRHTKFVMALARFRQIAGGVRRQSYRYVSDRISVA